MKLPTGNFGVTCYYDMAQTILTHSWQQIGNALENVKEYYHYKGEIQQASKWRSTLSDHSISSKPLQFHYMQGLIQLLWIKVLSINDCDDGGVKNTKYNTKLPTVRGLLHDEEPLDIQILILKQHTCWMCLTILF